MFEDEAGFGRINKPKRCWCPKGQRPSVPCHHIREYRYAFGAVEPLSGESFFLTMPNCDTECTNIFLEKLSEQYPDDIILLVCDGAAWHKSKALRCPENIQLLSIPPYTPEMNPIEQIWKQIRSMGFRNEVFDSLSAVMDRLCETICLLTTDMVKSITGRQWIIECFYIESSITIDSDISASVSATLGSGDVVRVFLDVYNPERRIWVERDSIKFHSSGSNIGTLFYTLDSNET